MELLGTLWDSWWHLLLNSLVGINSVVHNPAISIVVFTVLIKLLTVPLTLKSLRSTRNMQQIQPLIKEIQKKYGKDKAKQQEETMKIYQQYGVNPAAGCFPMLVQLPIFFGLYSALNWVITNGADVEKLKPILLNASWIHWADFNQQFLWVHNLAKPDPIYILPLLSGLFQFVQSRMAMPIRDPNQPLDPQTKMMNNMMQFMPLYIIFISINFPAGTVIYWAASNVFSAVQQYFITGWGSLPNVPGLGFLPKRAPFVPAPLPAPALADGVSGPPARKGMMGWMMDKALAAQDAQKAAGAVNGSTAAATNGTYQEPAEAPRVKKKGSEPQVERQQVARIVPTTTMKYASDLKHREDVNGNGVTTGSSQLPRKKKNKK